MIIPSPNPNSNSQKYDNQEETLHSPKKVIYETIPTTPNSQYESLAIEGRTFKAQVKKTYLASPIGLLGFSLSCIIAGLVNVEVVTYSYVSATIYLFFGGLFQYLAGIADWRQGYTLNAALSVLYGCFNLNCVLWVYFPASQIAPPLSSRSTAFFNLVWCILEGAAVSGNFPGVLVMFVDHSCVFITFFFSMLYGFTEMKVFNYISGVTLIIQGIITFYAAFALVINNAYDRTIFPVFIRGEKYCWWKKTHH